MSKLRDILQEEVRAEIEKIREEADVKSREVLLASEREAASRVAKHRKRTEATIRTAVRRAQSAAELTISTTRAEARGKVMDQVREKALTAIQHTLSKPNYGEILEALAGEAMNSIEEPESLVVNPEDQDKLNEWATQKGIELRIDPAVRLGVRVVGRSGRTIENTLPERLDRAWETLAAEVAKLLWG